MSKEVIRLEKTIKHVQFPAPSPSKLKRVVAYTRVSSGKDSMLHSLSAQVSYYSNLIQNHPGWLYCGVFADEAITGTKCDRPNFQRLLQSCRQGEVDMIITKSVSRFARNTVLLLETVRELKNLGIDVYFEEQHIHTLSADGELMLTILAGFAEEESRSVSENMKWRVKKNFQNGSPWNGTVYGYRFSGDCLVIVPDEAEIVKRIFNLYLSGLGPGAIAKELNDSQVQKRDYWSWSSSGIWKMLRNPTYKGDLILQKTYRQDFLSKKPTINHGERDSYYVECAHEPIIDPATFDLVQEQIAKRYKAPSSRKDPLLFTSLLKCGICGANFEHKIRTRENCWICRTYNRKGKQYCPSKQIPESALNAAAIEVLGDATNIHSSVSEIIIGKENLLTFRLVNGDVKETKWVPHSRSESWSQEKRELAKARATENWRKHK